MKFAILLSVLILAQGVVGSAQAQFGGVGSAISSVITEALQGTGKDGSVNRAEFKDMKLDAFTRKDENGDQILSREELSDVSAATFNAVDKDGDNQITLTEFDQAVKFEYADQNHDDSISTDEFTAFRESFR